MRNFLPSGHIKSVKQRSLVIKQLDSPFDGHPWLDWSWLHCWHGGGVGGLGQPEGQCGGGVILQPEHGWGRKQTEHWGVGGNKGIVGWIQGKQGGLVVGCGQFCGQNGWVEVLWHPGHGWGIKQAEQDGAGVWGNVGKLCGNVWSGQGMPINHK